MDNKVTIDQVAAMCGVSKTSISRCLNHIYENICESGEVAMYEITEQ